MENPSATDGVQDVLCKAHVVNSHSYWDQKVEKLNQLKKHVSKTLRNHCQKFFTEMKPRRVENLSEAVSR